LAALPARSAYALQAALLAGHRLGRRRLRAGERLLELAINRLGLSARAYTRILKVARPRPTSTAAARSKPAT